MNLDNQKRGVYKFFVSNYKTLKNPFSATTSPMFCLCISYVLSMTKIYRIHNEIIAKNITLTPPKYTPHQQISAVYFERRR